MADEGAATARPARTVRARVVVVTVVLLLLAAAGFAASQLLGRTEVLGVSRVEARSDSPDVILVAGHNDCSNDPTARIVHESSDAVTVRAERRRGFLADSCDDVGEQTEFRLVLTEPLGDRTIIVEAPYEPSECVVDGAASGRCDTVAP